MRWIYGGYGVGNLGDDLLLISALNKWGKDCKVISYGIPQIDFDVKFIDFNLFINNLDLISSNTDEFIIGGGGVFWSEGHINDIFKIAKHIKKIGGKFIVDSIGTQGCSSAPEIVEKIIELSDDFTVRDRDSIRQLKMHNISNLHKVRQSEDLALIIDYSQFKNIQIESKKTIVAINYAVPNAGIEEFESFVGAISKISDILAENFEFYYLGHTRHNLTIDENDYITAENFRVISRNRVKSFIPTNVKDLLGFYKSVDLTIGFRYHMSVISIAMNIPNLSISFGYGKYFAIADEKDTSHLNIRDKDKGYICEKILKWIEENPVIENNRTSGTSGTLGTSGTSKSIDKKI